MSQNENEQLEMALSSPDCPVFGDFSYTAVYSAIRQMVDESGENVELKTLTTKTAIYMLGSNAFDIIINAKKKCIKTTSKVALDYVDSIGGAVAKKDGVYIPIDCGAEYYDAVKKLVNAIYESKQRATTSEMIGCCDMFVMCSDARRCLRSGDPDYRRCLYRENLEAGRIFYGKNKNI